MARKSRRKNNISEIKLVTDKNARSFYEQEATNSNWSVRELRRQVNASLFERLFLSDGSEIKKRF